MSHLSRAYLYFTTATLLLAITLLATDAQETDSGASRVGLYDQFKDIKPQCRSRMHPHTIKVHSKCYVRVTSRKCKGYCTSFTDFQLEPPYLTRDCACCKPHGTVTYKIEMHKCFVVRETGNVETGEEVKIAVPHEMECECKRCSRIKQSG